METDCLLWRQPCRAGAPSWWRHAPETCSGTHLSPSDMTAGLHAKPQELTQAGSGRRDMQALICLLLICKRGHATPTVMSQCQPMFFMKQLGESAPAKPRPMSTPAWVYCGTLGLLYNIHVRVMGAEPFAIRSPACQRPLLRRLRKAECRPGFWEREASVPDRVPCSGLAARLLPAKGTSRTCQACSPVATPL